MLRLHRHENGPRVYLVEYRLHHGTTGIFFSVGCLLTRRFRLALIPLLLTLHDWRDWKVWFAREAWDVLESDSAAPVDPRQRDPEENVGTL